MTKTSQGGFDTTCMLTLIFLFYFQGDKLVAFLPRTDQVQERSVSAKRKKEKKSERSAKNFQSPCIP